MVARRPPQSGSTHLSANKSNPPLQLTRTLVTSNTPSTVPTLKWRNGEGAIKSFLNSLVMSHGCIPSTNIDEETNGQRKLEFWAFVMM